MEKRWKGRPRKKEDSIEFWQFARAARVMSAYDEARERGDKHSVAVRSAWHCRSGFTKRDRIETSFIVGGNNEIAWA